MKLLRDYVGYARAVVKPKLSEEARQQLIHCYLDMRKVGAGKVKYCLFTISLSSKMFLGCNLCLSSPT